MDIEYHIKGLHCKECCCHKFFICNEKNCAGILHMRIVDYNEDGSVHNYKCEKCYKEYWDEFGYDEYKIEFR